MKLLNKVCLFLMLNFIRNFSVFGDFDIVSVTETWVYVPDTEGNWYWQDLDDMGEIPRYNEETDVQFWLYTRRNVNDGQQIKLRDNASIEESHYDRNSPTRVLIQGWRSSINTTYAHEAKKAYLNVGDFNVIIVDWGKIAQNPIYPIPARRTKDVGITVANFLNFLYDQGYLNSFNNLTIVGHSLGAHVAGITGKHTTHKAAALYGLDPAGPMFFQNAPHLRFDKDDAQLTVSLRTNAGPLAYGYGHPLAHMEFLPNGGMTQPGCNLYFFNHCAHLRALDLFTESIELSNFVSVGCSSFDEIKQEKCTPTGATETFVAENIKNAHGYYYLKTDYDSPYGLGSEGKPNASVY